MAITNLSAARIGVDFGAGPRFGLSRAQFVGGTQTSFVSRDVFGTDVSAVMEFPTCGGVEGGVGAILGVSFVYDDAPLNTQAWRLMIFDAEPTDSTHGGQSAFTTADHDKLIGAIDLSTAVDLTIGPATTGYQSPPGVRLPFACAAGTRSLYGVLFTTATVTIAASKQATITLQLERG